MVSKEDPPAVYIKSASFHEADFDRQSSQPPTGNGTNQSSKSRELSKESELAKSNCSWCDPSALFDNPWCDASGLVDHVLAIGTKSRKGGEEEAHDFHLSSPSSHDFSEFSTDDSSANHFSAGPSSFDHNDVDSNQQSMERRGRFLVWPAKD